MERVVSYALPSISYVRTFASVDALGRGGGGEGNTD